MMDKARAGYQISGGPEQCANCVMFKSGSCDLVMGLIEPYAMCIHWEPNPGDVTSVGQYLVERRIGSVPVGLTQ